MVLEGVLYGLDRGIEGDNGPKNGSYHLRFRALELRGIIPNKGESNGLVREDESELGPCWSS